MALIQMHLKIKHLTSLKRFINVETDDLFVEVLPGRLSADVPVAPPKSKVT